MAAAVQQVFVASPAEIQNAVQSFIAQGFTVQTQSPDSVTMFKRKEFNVIWAVIGFFLCLIPLLIYCIIYASESDQMVVIRIGQGGGPAPSRWSPDGRMFWDGVTWRDGAAAGIPSGAPISDDGRLWWDGFTWRPISGQLPPASATAAP